MTDKILEEIVSEYHKEIRSINQIDIDGREYYSASFIVNSCQKYHAEKMKEVVERLPKEKLTKPLTTSEQTWYQNRGFNNCLYQFKKLLEE